MTGSWKTAHLAHNMSKHSEVGLKFTKSYHDDIHLPASKISSLCVHFSHMKLYQCANIGMQANEGNHLL